MAISVAAPRRHQPAVAVTDLYDPQRFGFRCYRCDLVGQLCHECCVHSGTHLSLLREVVGQAIVATGDTHSHRGDPPVFSARSRNDETAGYARAPTSQILGA